MNPAKLVNVNSPELVGLATSGLSEMRDTAFNVCYAGHEAKKRKLWVKLYHCVVTISVDDRWSAVGGDKHLYLNNFCRMAVAELHDPKLLNTNELRSDYLGITKAAYEKKYCNRYEFIYNLLVSDVAIAFNHIKRKQGEYQD